MKNRKFPNDLGKYLNILGINLLYDITIDLLVFEWFVHKIFSPIINLKS